MIFLPRGAPVMTRPYRFSLSVQLPYACNASRTAAGYRSAGRSAIGDGVRSFNAFASGTLIDNSARPAAGVLHEATILVPDLFPAVRAVVFLSWSTAGLRPGYASAVGGLGGDDA